MVEAKLKENFWSDIHETMASKSVDTQMVNANNEQVDVVTIPRKKPDMTLPSELMGRSSLFIKTQSLLNKLKESNEQLIDKMQKNGPESVSIEVTDTDKTSSYIDMDLYLGVLEEKDPKSQKEQIKATTDKLLGINQGPKKSIVMEESDNVENVQAADNDNDTEDTCDEDVDL